MIRRQRTGSVICPSCGLLVGVNDQTCYHCGRRNPGMWGFGPMVRALGRDFGLAPFIIGACCVVYVLTLLKSPELLSGGGLLSFLSPDNIALVEFGASGRIPVFTLDRWWTVLSAGWLHGGLLHIFFNMYSIRQLMPAVVDIYGPGRTTIIYVVGSAAGFAVSSLASYSRLPLAGAALTVGASAGISALIGALWHYGRRSGNSMARSYATTSVIYMIVIGLMLPFIDNYAHAGGVAGGFLLSMLLDPLRQERGDHMAIALVCLVASLGAIVVSLLVPLQLS